MICVMGKVDVDVEGHPIYVTYIYILYTCGMVVNIVELMQEVCL